MNQIKQAQLKQWAYELQNNEALEMILQHIEQDLAGQFPVTHDDDLVGLKRQFEAVGWLRSEIQSRLLTYLETG